MAKRSTSRKKTTRKRRMGAAGSRKSNMSLVLGAVAGAVVQGIASAALSKPGDDGKPKVDPKIIGAGSIALGIFLPKFVKNNQLVNGMALGLAAAGGSALVKEMGILNGLPLISGMERQLPLLNGVVDDADAFVTQPQGSYQKFGNVSSVASVINGMSRQYDENRLG